MATKKPVSVTRKRAQQRMDTTRKARDDNTYKQLIPIAKEINVRLDKAADIEAKADDHRLAAALKLAEAKKLCDKSKVSFKKWCDSNFTQSEREIRKLVSVGISDNPVKAIEDLRKGAKTRMARKRARDAAAPKTASRDTTQRKTAFAIADEALESLDDTVRMTLATDHLAKAGMAVIPKAEVKELRRDAQKTRDAGAKAATVSDVMEVFNRLSASDKMEFLNRAADSIGAKISHDFADTKEDPLDIPEKLRRRKKS